MRLRNTLFLALIFAVLAGYVYYVELRHPAQHDGSEKVLEFEPARLTSIELEHPGRLVVLERLSQGWRMVEPIATAADQRAVENLIAAVDESRLSRALEDPGDLATYALDAPSAVLRLRGDGDEATVLSLGKKTPVGNSAYIMREGDSAVYLTDAILLDRLDLTATHLRDKAIVAFETDRVTGIRMTGARQIAIERDESGWRITEPAQYAADPANVASLLSTLQSMRAVEFFDDAEERLQHFGLAAPEATIVIQIDGDEEIELRIGNERDGRLRLQTNFSPTVYAVAAWMRDSLQRDVGYFRDKTIVRFVADEATELRIEDADRPPVSLRRADSGWTLDARPASATVVEDVLRELTSLTGFEIAAEAAADMAAFGLDPPQRSLRVFGADGEQIAAVDLGSYAADAAQTEFTAVVPGSTTVFHIRQFEFANLTTPIARLAPAEANSEGAAPPVPDGETGDDVDENAFDDTAAAGEEG